MLSEIASRFCRIEGLFALGNACHSWAEDHRLQCLCLAPEGSMSSVMPGLQCCGARHTANPEGLHGKAVFRNAVLSGRCHVWW